MKYFSVPLFGFCVGVMLITLGLDLGEATARERRARLHDPQVNTRVERRFDHNHDGKIGPQERRQMHQARRERHEEREQHHRERMHRERHHQHQPEQSSEGEAAE